MSMDTYQPIYDAVRSRISNGDIGAAVERAVNNANIGHYVQCAMENLRFIAGEVAQAHTRPSVICRPTLTRDGNAWCALYGEDIMSGVAGFGDTPEAAMAAFDAAWGKP